MSKFIEDAVRWRLFSRTIHDIKQRNAATDPVELEQIINEAVREARAERSPKPTR